MNKTRLSLYYLVTYLFVGGACFLFAPQFSTDVLLSNAVYSDELIGAFGMFMVGLGIIVAQIIRLRLQVLYSTSLLVRVFFCICLIFFYVKSLNPMFMMLFGIVFLGVVLTAMTYYQELKAYN